MSCLEISGGVLADFPFTGTFSDEFPNFAPTELNFLEFPFSNHRAQRAGDKSVPLSPFFYFHCTASKTLRPQYGIHFASFTWVWWKIPWPARGWNEILKSLPTQIFYDFGKLFPLSFSFSNFPWFSCQSWTALRVKVSWSLTTKVWLKWEKEKEKWGYF